MAEVIQFDGSTTVHEDGIPEPAPPLDGAQTAQDGSRREPAATSHPDNSDTPTPSQTAPEGDPSLTRQVQQPHPFADPVANSEAQPKVDAGDSGAAVGERPDLDAISNHVGQSLNVEAGFVGYNPDPNSNEDYTMDGVIAARGEAQ